MDRFRELLIDVWREACRHIEIAESAGTIARLLVSRLPICRLIVRRVEVEHDAVRTVAVGPVPSTETPVDEVTASGSARKLAAWCRQGQSLLVRAGERVRQPVAAGLPRAMHGPVQHDLFVGPLWSEHGAAGMLLIEASSRPRFTSDHEKMAAMLLEPLATALENDARLRELVALRAAAEADKRSLLTRLGREKIVDEIVGVDAGLRPVMQRVGLVARSDVPVLILGETGTGKEVIARAIHNDSPRCSGPFVRVNCGAIPPELIDSQLFGHEKGSFTGATDQRKGWFERADGGTLFLDEVGELPLAAQVRLLRILQDGTFERVGGQEPIRVNIRLVTATHRDLTAMVREARFREDLWYRIAVFPILLPPLRDRREDIAALAHHFAHRAAIRFGLTVCTPHPADLALLTQYDWPGNVRELQAVIDRAAILGQGQRLDIAPALGASPPAVAPPAGAQAAPTLATATITLDEAIKRHIQAALAVTHGRIEGPHGAARLLQINPHTLRARMRKLHLDWASFRQRGRLGAPTNRA